MDCIIILWTKRHTAVCLLGAILSRHTLTHSWKYGMYTKVSQDCNIPHWSSWHNRGQKKSCLNSGITFFVCLNKPTNQSKLHIDIGSANAVARLWSVPRIIRPNNIRPWELRCSGHIFSICLVWQKLEWQLLIVNFEFELFYVISS